MPDNGYRLRLDPAAVDAVRSLPFVSWLGAPPPHFKLQAQLAAHATQPVSPVPIRVILEKDESPDRVRAILAAPDVRSAASGKDRAWRLQATVAPDRLSVVLSRAIVGYRMVQRGPLPGADISFAYRLVF